VPPNLGATLVNWQTGLSPVPTCSATSSRTQASPLVAGVYAFTAKVSDSSMMARSVMACGSLNTNAPGMRSIESYFPRRQTARNRLCDNDATAVWNLSPAIGFRSGWLKTAASTWI